SLSLFAAIDAPPPHRRDRASSPASPSLPHSPCLLRIPPLRVRIERRLAQGFTGLLQAQPPQFPWPAASHKRIPFEIDLPVVPFGASRGARAGKEFFLAAAVASIIDIGRRPPAPGR
ncbi:Os05g0285900, partial [Oryza sativa Japonica Group]